jgi:predicted tellurium resistance membrane protein TerC
VAAVVLVTFVFTTLIHEPALIVTLLAVLVLSIGLDLWWNGSAPPGWAAARRAMSRSGTRAFRS